MYVCMGTHILGRLFKITLIGVNEIVWGRNTHGFLQPLLFYGQILKAVDSERGEIWIGMGPCILNRAVGNTYITII